RKSYKDNHDHADQQKYPSSICFFLVDDGSLQSIVPTFVLSCAHLLQFFLEETVQPPHQQKPERRQGQGVQKVWQHPLQQNQICVVVPPHRVVEKIFQQQPARKTAADKDQAVGHRRLHEVDHQQPHRR